MTRARQHTRPPTTAVNENTSTYFLFLDVMAASFEGIWAWSTCASITRTAGLLGRTVEDLMKSSTAAVASLQETVATSKPCV